MKTAAFALFSLVLAAIVYGVLLAVVGTAIIAIHWVTETPVFASALGNSIAELVLVYVPAFMTGLLLARVKPFYLPMATASLGTMVYWGGPALLIDEAPLWGRLGLVVSVGAVTILGSLLATQLGRRTERECVV